MVKTLTEKLVLVAVFMAFGAIWMQVVVPLMVASAWFLSLEYVWQWLLYHVGMYVVAVGIYILLYVLFRPRAAQHWVQIALSSLGLFLLQMFTTELWDTPLYLMPSGLPNPIGAAALPGTMIDAVLAQLWGACGITGPALYVMVYDITPVIVFVIAVVLLHPRWIYASLGVA